MRGSADRHLAWVAGRDPGSGPSDRALHQLTGWYAIALRLWIAVAVVVAAPLAATAAVSGPWLAVVLVVLSAWSVIFAWQVRHHGLTAPLVLADAAVIVALVGLHRLVVPAALIAAGTTWMLPLASTAVYIAELAFAPALGLPVAAVVVAAYVGAVPHPAGAPYLVIQAVVTAALMTLVRRGGRNADAVIARELAVAQEMQAEAARRADQRHQYRRLHDTILSTLTMVAAGALDQPSPVLSAQAARDLLVLHTLPSAPEADRLGTVSLGDRLRDVAAGAAPLRVALAVSAPDDQVPAAAADRLADCAAEALRNVAQHAGTSGAQMRLSGGPGRLVVQIIDQGRGFEAQSVSRASRGISESIRGRMSEVGGSAEVSGAPGRGTTVTLRWPG